MEKYKSYKKCKHRKMILVTINILQLELLKHIKFHHLHTLFQHLARLEHIHLHQIRGIKSLGTEVTDTKRTQLQTLLLTSSKLRNINWDKQIWVVIQILQILCHSHVVSNQVKSFQKITVLNNPLKYLIVWIHVVIASTSECNKNFSRRVLKSQSWWRNFTTEIN